MIAVALTMCWMTGCDRFSVEYGNSKGILGRQSLNGFGGFRRTFQSSGFETRDVTRLTDRVGRSDVIVWTPQEYGPIPSDATKWFGKWLKKGNRTLVYVIPDSGSEVDYWREASRFAPPSQRLEYRKRAARATNQRSAWRLNRSAIPSNGWFHVTPDLSQSSPSDDGNFVAPSYRFRRTKARQPHPPRRRRQRQSMRCPALAGRRPTAPIHLVSKTARQL